jgi:hypothetical protein
MIGRSRFRPTTRPKARAEPSSVARHNRPAQRDRTDDSDASIPRPTVSHQGAPNNPRALTPLDPARSFMDDNPPSEISVTTAGIAFGLPG